MTKTKDKVVTFILDYMIYFLFVLLVVILWIAKSTFMTWGNWMAILRSASMKGVISFGMCMVIIGSNVDLSTGSTIALAGVIVAICCRKLTAAFGEDFRNMAAVIGVVICILVTFIFGYEHAWSTHKLGMPAFIVTTATQGILYGAAGMLSGGENIANIYPQWFINLGMGRIPAGNQNGIPVPVLVLAIIFGITYFIMGYTTTGRSIYATGGNQEAARLSGINVFRSKVVFFVAVQMMAALGGLINSAQLSSGSFTYGRDWGSDIIASVVIGGTPMGGGAGTVVGTMIGILFIGVLTNGMTILNFSVYSQFLIRGIVLFGAVFISATKERNARKK